MKKYLKSLEENYKQKYSWKNILLVWEKWLFLSWNDEDVENTINSIVKQISSVTKFWVGIKFLTDFSYKWLNEKLKINEKDFFYHNWDLIDKSFELSKQLNIEKIIYLTKNSIKGIIYNKEEKLNYINPQILKKLELKGKNKTIITKILNLLEHQNPELRFHFINILQKNSLYNELFTLYWEWNWNWVLVSLNYKLDIEKLKNTSEEELVFLYNILKKLSKNDWFVKYKSLEYIKKNKNNFYVYRIDWASVWMFEVKDLWNFSKEIWTVILDPNFQWWGIWARMMEKIIELHKKEKYKYFNFIIVTGNKVLKKILEKEWIWKISKEELKKDIDLKNRYLKLIEDNQNDWKNREMYIF